MSRCAAPVRIPPGPGQESVWDYPRPPRLEPTGRRIRVIFNGETIADSRAARRVLETSQPPVYYLPPEDVRVEFLHRSAKQSFCAFKGVAIYYDVVVGERTARDAAWSYPDPSPAYAALAKHIAFDAGPMDACFVDDVLVTPQAGRSDGGWVTPDVVGPFNGDPGTAAR